MLSRYRKAVTAVVGAALIIVAQFLPDTDPAVISTVLAVLTALGVYGVANTE